MEALDAPYLEIAFWRMVRKRAGWLAVLFVGEMLTATAMGYFEQEIAKAVVLALFVPPSSAAGVTPDHKRPHSSSRNGRREVRLSDWWRIIRREFSTGFVLGSVLAAIGLTRILIWQAIWAPTDHTQSLSQHGRPQPHWRCAVRHCFWIHALHSCCDALDSILQVLPPLLSQRSWTSQAW